MDPHPGDLPSLNDYSIESSNPPKDVAAPWACAGCGTIIVHRVSFVPVSWLQIYLTPVLILWVPVVVLSYPLYRGLVPATIQSHPEKSVVILFALAFGIALGVGGSWNYSEARRLRRLGQTRKPLRCPTCGGSDIRKPIKAVDRSTARGLYVSEADRPTATAMLADPKRRFLVCPSCNQRAFIPTDSFMW